jgi:uncharacterized membrane protein YkvA (DUF1232 family)
MFLYQAFKRGLRNPQVRPWLLTASIAYLISPIDLIPAFFPGVGQLDDLVVLSFLVRALISLWLEDPLAILRQAVQQSDPGSLQDQANHRSSVGGDVIDVTATPID